MAEKQTINVAVIGAGNMGSCHARNYFELPGARLVAIADPQKGAKYLARKFKCNYYDDYQKMLDCETIEAASVAVPTSLHEQVALDLIKRRINLLVEKPIAGTVRQAESIIAAARRNNVILTVGHIERFNPAVRKLKKIIVRGGLGQILSVVSKRVGPFVPRINDAGVLIDLAVHDIDIINHLLQREPLAVHVKGGKAINGYKDDHAEIFLDYGTTSGYIQVNYVTPVKIREMHVTGTKGYAQLNYISQEVSIYKVAYKKKTDMTGGFLAQSTGPRQVPVKIKIQEPLKMELRSFLENVKNNTTPEVTASEAVAALRVALKALKKI